MTDSPATIPVAAFEVEQYRMPNGLRVVLSPDRSVPVIGVAVVYDVGIRSEPERRTGFAHLFEHMMFQGSANVGKTEHMKLVQGAGGMFNGSTHIDYTDYYDVMPSNGLELALFLEADRMAGPAITEENLLNQVSVVKEEIRVNVQNRPYGGFPWITFPQVMFDTFPNAHDGYGSFADLDAATTTDAQQFFDTFYPASNAVLSLVGDFDPAEATRLIDKHFSHIDYRPKPQHPAFDEPDLTVERRSSYTDKRATLPAVAVGWRIPDPGIDLDAALPYIVLGDLLTDGDASRLKQRMVHTDRNVTAVGSYVGLMGEPFATRGPTPFLVRAFLPPDTSTDTILASLQEELGRIAEDGLSLGELRRVQAKIATRELRQDDSIPGRAQRLATTSTFHGDASEANTFARRIARVTAEDIRAAAATFTENRRAVLEVIPGGRS
ncbi:M16 family metallopeptidase [Natronoglycomyces albus]|uniref:Insulinase family protein n=1 Tax=Natronoglycomyces albus TaxID=2811108 RepID=A0A895XS67_9ACTN|nr:pitrilysin family protein [Natronoglycomyces albus]QSB06055.1 insulinase family protein [Natronoglycomyces albus]